MIANVCPHPVMAPCITFMFIFGAFAVNFICIELEDPFGEDPNDLPLASFQAEMNNCLLMLLHPDADLVAGCSGRCIAEFSMLQHSVKRRHGGFRDEIRKTSSNFKQRASDKVVFDRDFTSEENLEPNDELDEISEGMDEYAPPKEFKDGPGSRIVGVDPTENPPNMVHGSVPLERQMEAVAESLQKWMG